ncbi:MAG: ABC transporter ATP-binding protein [Bacillota bacterium]
MNAVEMRGICKYFGSFCANDNVAFTLREGEVHALLGENGAGKSTLMNILYGLYSHDSGTIEVYGKNIGMESPSVAIESGIGMVHQHFMLIPQLTVTHNIFLGMKETGFALKMKDLDKRVRELNDKFGFNVDPSALIWQLPVGVQQKVEILKILMRRAKILILDEPTAVLTPNEVEEFFSIIRSLASGGYSIILITHKMEEVLKYSDFVTVMRQGQVIGSKPTKDVTANELADMMVGRQVNLKRQLQEQEPGDVALAVEHLTVKNINGLSAVNDISFRVRKGEILGIAGVDGNGQLELGEAIVGYRKALSGSVLMNGVNVLGKSISYRLEQGMSHIPDDRHKKGLILPFTVKENLIMGLQHAPELNRGPLMNWPAVDRLASRLVAEFDIRPDNIDFMAGSMSGGNQQKVILAREVERHPSVIIAIQPTRGLDIGATEFVRGKLVEECRNGAAILLISTDLDEIISLSSRILVMFNGASMGEVRYDTPLYQIGLLMAGKKPEQTNVEKEVL